MHVPHIKGNFPQYIEDRAYSNYRTNPIPEVPRMYVPINLKFGVIENLAQKRRGLGAIREVDSRRIQGEVRRCSPRIHRTPHIHLGSYCKYLQTIINEYRQPKILDTWWIISRAVIRVTFQTTSGNCKYWRKQIIRSSRNYESIYRKI